MKDKKKQTTCLSMQVSASLHMCILDI